MGQKAGSILRRAILRRDNVHCSQAIGDVDVVPVVTDLDFEKSRVMTVCLRCHTAVQSGFNFR